MVFSFIVKVKSYQEIGKT